jgi:endonuclease/exonuclease/phosphatase family metal-dependent hydrolase
VTTDHLHVATLNLRYFGDRWDERLPLILADMRALQPDVLGLQECIFPMQQDRLIGAAGAAEYIALRGTPAEPEIGNSLLVQQPIAVSDVERLELGEGRYAIIAGLTLALGTRVRAAVTHLHHIVPAADIRDQQAALLIAGLDGGPAVDAVIVIGDFNGEPDEPMYARMVDAGYRSAYAEANGSEPAVTWPSGLQPPAPGNYDPGCFDYIWIRGQAEVDSCRLVFDRPAVDDPGLLPSDHFGLGARLRVGSR